MKSPRYGTLVQLNLRMCVRTQEVESNDKDLLHFADTELIGMSLLELRTMICRKPNLYKVYILVVSKYR